MISPKEQEIILQLAAEITGLVPTAKTPPTAIFANVERRMAELGISSVVKYLQHVDKHPEEHSHLVSALTIHTTSWFRENPHFVIFQEMLLDTVKKNETFKLWCAACSTGEEVYSFGLILEEFRRVHPGFDYRILGTDIDPVSVASAKRAIYPKKQIDFHLSRYKRHLLEGSGKTEGLFTVSKAIRDRCQFRIHDLRSPQLLEEGPFHACVCRNVLIYFPNETVNLVVGNLVRNLKSMGRLLLGHSESVPTSEHGLTSEGHSVYMKRPPNQRGESKPTTKYRILSVDDSLMARKFLEKTFTNMGFESITVASGSEATNYLNFNDVDLVTLDLHMPDVSGDKWLASERSEGLRTPVVIISETRSGEAADVVKLLSLGADHFIEKSKLSENPLALKETLLELIRSGLNSRSKPAVQRKNAPPKQRPRLIMIGASTGGPQALVKVLQNMPADVPPIVITQHISPKFARPLAERLSEVSGLRLGPSEDHTRLLPGHIYMSFGDYHLGIEEEDEALILRTSTAPPFNGHRPSVDHMFNSVIGLEGPLMAILLTGMGRDGSLGLRFLHKEGVYCVAQSEEDCVVYGMPREAIERGAVNFVGNLDDIRNLIINAVKLTRAAS